MVKFERITEDQFKKLMEEIYIAGEKSENIVISDFMGEVEKKILSLLVGKMYPAGQSNKVKMGLRNDRDKYI